MKIIGKTYMSNSNHILDRQAKWRLRTGRTKSSSRLKDGEND